MAKKLQTHEALTDIVREYEQLGVPILGYVTWFSVPDQPVELRKLRLQWSLAQLDERVLPDEPRPLYLFKRAMREQEGKVKRPDGSVEETDVRMLLEDGQFCIYQVSRVTRDKEKRVIDYPKALRVVFHKDPMMLNQEPDGPIEFQAFKESSMADVQPMIDGIRQFYNKRAKMIDGRKVREMVRSYIREDTIPPSKPDADDGATGLSGENLRGKGGGVYFVKAEHADALKGLAEALEHVYEDGTAYLLCAPLPDGKGARQLVRERHVNNTVKEMQEAMVDVAKLLRNDRKQAIRGDHIAFHWRKLAALKKRAAEYQELLGEEVDDVARMAGSLEKQLDKLPTLAAAT